MIGLVRVLWVLSGNKSTNKINENGYSEKIQNGIIP